MSKFDFNKLLSSLNLDKQSLEDFKRNLFFRGANNSDIDELYSSPDAEIGLEPFFGPMEIRKMKGGRLIENKKSNWKYFLFLDDFEKNDITDWRVFLDKDKNIVVLQERYFDDCSKFFILFSSSEIENKLEYLCHLTLLLIMVYGYFFEGKSEYDYWDDYNEENQKINFLFANDKGRY